MRAWMPDTSNTTSPADPSDRLAPAPAASRLLACVICQSTDEPQRIGESTRSDPRGKRAMCIGRDGDPFFRWRAGERVDCGRLRSTKISGEQLHITPEGDGARIHNVGRVSVLVDPSPWADPSRLLPQHHSTFVQLPAVVEIVGHSVMLLTWRSPEMPAPHPLLLPLHPFGVADAMGIVGESERAWLLRLAIARAAERGIPVLIVGETGTGKELVARGIHAKSRFARGPFIEANCASLRGELAALELFGGQLARDRPCQGGALRGRRRHGVLDRRSARWRRRRALGAAGRHVRAQDTPRPRSCLAGAGLCGCLRAGGRDPAACVTRSRTGC
jgi:hypothetical protein